MIRFIGTLSAMAALAAMTIVPSVNAAETIDAKSVKISVESLAKLDNPWGMAYLPDGRLLITEKPGRLKIFADGKDGKLSEPIGGVPKVEFKDQGGLLDVAVDPDFANNSFIYLSYTERAEQQPKDAKVKTDPRLGKFVDPEDKVLKGTAVARGRLEGDALKDVVVIWRQEPFIVGLNHFGGRLVFSPDGKLFHHIGRSSELRPRAGSLGQRRQNRPHQSGRDAASGQSVRFEIRRARRRVVAWASQSARRGDPSGFGPLWIHEMAPEGGDEINIIKPGENYGWPTVTKARL